MATKDVHKNASTNDACVRMYVCNRLCVLEGLALFEHLILEVLQRGGARIIVLQSLYRYLPLILADAHQPLHSFLLIRLLKFSAL